MLPPNLILSCSRIALIAASLVVGFASTLVAAQGIVGAWSSQSGAAEGANVVVFLANGYYIHVQNASPSAAPAGFDGYEHGSYSWDAGTGAFTVTTLTDTNGDVGLSGVSGRGGMTVAVAGDTLTAQIPGAGAVTLSRVGAPNPIVGAWLNGSGTGFAGTDWDLYVFFSDGTYLNADHGPLGGAGIEHGTYAWDASSGSFTSSRTPSPPFVDTNGNPGGLSFFRADAVAQVVNSGTRLSIGDVIGYTFANRVGAPSAANYGGIWWRSPAGSESGWGINFAHQGDTIFATWFTYDAAGKAWWLTMTATKTAAGIYSGDVYQSRGPAFSAVPFSPAAVVTTQVGTGTLTFIDVDNGSFAYTVNGVTQTKTITKTVFATVPTCTFGATNLAAATNYQDIWWAAPAGAESGWGVNFTHQGDTIFVTWFTYDVDGSPLWLQAVAQKTAPGVYSGTLYRNTGPPFSAVPFLPANVTQAAVGTLTITFTHGNSATYAYTVTPGSGAAVTQSKTIERTVFVPPGTVCN